jgi:molecular chaperone GrpE
MTFLKKVNKKNKKMKIETNQNMENKTEAKAEDLNLYYEELQKELEETKKLAEERLNQLKYLQADFDNYRKKFDREKDDIIKLANENLIKELIIIVDDFERCLEQFENSEAKNGLILVQRNFFKILEKHGLKDVYC